MKNAILAGVVVTLLSGCVTTGTQPIGEVPQQRKRAELHAQLASQYYAQGNMAVALDEFNLAARIDAGYPFSYTGLGLVYSALKEDDKAESNFRRALQLDPSSSETHNNFGAFLCDRGRYDESIKEFMTAVKDPLYSTPEMAYVNAGVCALKKKDDQAAETYLLHALEYRPTLRQAQFQLAQIYFARQDFSMARQYLLKAMQNVDPGPDMLWLGVRIERNLGGGDAEASYRLLLKNKFPDSPQTKAMLSGE